ncbi:PREDICTED: mucin-5AC-like [Papilio xuthus]|uniref:Lysozyme n=1 Tax=Papilio xuthus TaxID=66420 RepID=A0AAJ6ZTY3_PAPXU|nr:PREDICTED: mucin-5AC-like [Papilio xuthus]
MYTVALLTSTLLALVGARIYERCELARDLLQLGVRKDHIATWVCIAYHESRFDTAARNPNSGDHGLLQISEIYWCGAGKACGLPCSALRDDDISDDVECALSIYEEHTRIQGNGFLAWVVYPHYCKHNAKKYLADCDHSTKDSSNKFEDRARASHDSYPNINFTSYNPVQSDFSYSQSDRSVPSFLSIVSLLRDKYEQDFEKDYNKNKNVNWAQFKIDNVDDLKLPDFNRRPNFNFLEPVTARLSTTSTTTMEPEPQYKPVKPWRTIETNSFRRRMMKFNNTPMEETRNKTVYENSLVVTTPKYITSTDSTNYSSSSTRRIIYDNGNSISSNACCSTVTQTNKTPSTIMEKTISYPTQNTMISFTTQKPSLFFTTQKFGISSTTQKPVILFTTRKPEISSTTQRSIISSTTQKPATSLSIPITQQYYAGLNSSEQVPKKVSEATENRAKSFWDKFGYLTTQSPKLKQVSFTSKSLETSTAKPYVSTQSQQFTASRVFPSPEYNSINIKKIATTTTTERTIFSTKPTVKQFPVTKPTAFAWRTTKGWTARPTQYTQRYNPFKTYVSEYRTDRPTFTWRRGKSWTNDYQNVTYFSTTKPTPSVFTSTETPSTTSRQYSNQDVFKSTKALSTTSAPLSTFSSNTTKSSVQTKERQELTERIVATTPATKTTFSIFDIYLNPAKRQQVPNYKVLFSDNSASNLKIFSGGTTSAPFNRNLLKKNLTFTSEVQN